MDKPQLTFIDVSGVGNSGKSAVVDLLREIDGIWTPPFQFEFDIIRIPGGILDLRHNLKEDWSPIRSRDCLLRFMNVAGKMGRNGKWWDLVGQFRSTSQHYDRVFGGRFTKLCQEFAESFIIGSYKAEWPYDDQKLTGKSLFLRKVLRRIGFRKQLLRDVQLVDGTNFDNKATELLNSLYKPLTTENETMIILNNAFEPFNPFAGLDMLANSFQIVVTRDPRDIYVSGLNRHAANVEDQSLFSKDNDGLNKSFLATDDIALFVQRYRLYNSKICQIPSDRILKIRFEDLIMDYGTICEKLYKFLEIDHTMHSRKETFFNPDISRKNIGLWKYVTRQKEIRYIENELEEFLAD